MGLTVDFTDDKGNNYKYLKIPSFHHNYDKNNPSKSYCSSTCLLYKDKATADDPNKTYGLIGSLDHKKNNYPLNPSKFQLKEIISFPINTNYGSDTNEITFDSAFGADENINTCDRVILHKKSGDTGTVPSGTTEDKVYWIGFKSDGAAELHNSRQDAANDINPVDIGSDVSGVIQIQKAPNDPLAAIYDKAAEGTDVDGNIVGTVIFPGGQKLDISEAIPDA